MPKVSSASSSSGWTTLRRLSWADRFLLLETLMRLAVARLAVLLLPFRFISGRLGRHRVESPAADDPSSAVALRRIKWALVAVSRRVPWRCMCLERGIAGKMMLRARGVPNTLYLGVAREAGRIDAHAWLRSGTFVVTGGEDHTRFAVVSMFADPGAGSGEARA